MFKGLILFIVASLPILELYSQIQHKKVFENSVWGIVFNIDNNFYSYETMNDFLISNDFLQLPNNQQLSQAISAGFVIKNDSCSLLSLEILANKLLMYSVNSSGFVSYGISMNLLYEVAKSKKFGVSPFVGIGLKSNELIIINENNTSTVSNNNLEETFYRKNNFDLKLGVRLDYELSFFGVRTKIGINPFYNVDIGNKNWFNYYGTNVAAIPKFSRSGSGFSFGYSIFW